jgi:hypothetical protein
MIPHPVQELRHERTKGRRDGSVRFHDNRPVFGHLARAYGVWRVRMT